MLSFHTSKTFCFILSKCILVTTSANYISIILKALSYLHLILYLTIYIFTIHQRHELSKAYFSYQLNTLSIYLLFMNILDLSFSIIWTQILTFTFIFLGLFSAREIDIIKQNLIFLKVFKIHFAWNFIVYQHEILFV